MLGELPSMARFVLSCMILCLDLKDLTHFHPVTRKRRYFAALLSVFPSLLRPATYIVICSMTPFDKRPNSS